MILSLVYLLILILIALAACGIGRPVVRAWIASDERNPVDDLVWSLAIGLVIAGTALFGLGLLGLLYPFLIRTLTLLAATAGLFDLVGWWRESRLKNAGWYPRHREPAGDSDTRPSLAIVGSLRWVMAMIAGATLITALAPPIAGDALCYHLELPKRFLLEHAVVELPYDENAAYPLLTEMWFLWGMALGGGTVAQLMHWLCGWLFAGGVYLLATPILGRRWSELAAAFALLSPGVNVQMTAPLNDLAVAAFTTLALAAWWRCADTQAATEYNSTSRWSVIGGWMLGGALGTKHVALLFVAAWGVVVLARAIRHRDRRTDERRAVATMLIVAMTLAGPWYLRAAWYRGDPVYPFLSRLAHTNQTDDSTPKSDKRPLGRSWVGLLTAPWQITIEPNRVGGRAHQVGPLWLLALPTLIVSRRLRGLRTLLVLAGLFVLQWYVLRQNVRFLLPVVPILAIATVWVLLEWRRWPRVPQRLAHAVVIASVLFLLAIPLRRATQQLSAVAGIESREAYLLRHEPTYAIAKQMHALGIQDLRLLSQEQRAFYFPARVTRESIFRRETHYNQRLESGLDLAADLQAAGFTHLLLVDAQGGETSYDQTLSRLYEQALQNQQPTSMTCVAESTFVDLEGSKRRYRLIQLGNTPQGLSVERTVACTSAPSTRTVLAQ